jgi:hypothetical protein
MALGSAKVRADTPWILQAPAQSQVQATTALSVAIPTQLTPLQLAALAVEVDNIDVTALAQIGAGTIRYVPPAPLASGNHLLKVVEYTNSGQQIAHGSWSFQVVVPSAPATARSTQQTQGPSVSAPGAPSDSASASAPSTTTSVAMPAVSGALAIGTQLTGSIDANANVRIAQSTLSSPAPRRVALNGNFNLSLTRPVATWTATGTLAGLYSSNTGTALTGQGFQPSQMGLTLAHGQDQVVLGDQSLAYSNLLVSGLVRRGVSATLAGLPWSTTAGAFVLRGSALVGLHGGLGTSDAGDRVAGAMLQTQPLTHEPQALTLMAGFVSGTSPPGLTVAAPTLGISGSLRPPGIFGSTASVAPGALSPMLPPGSPSVPGMAAAPAMQSGSGNAWMVGFDSQALGGKLQLHGQYAMSSFDFPALLGATSVHADDHAESLEADFNTPLPELWTLGLQISDQSVGTYFRSLANPALAPDQWLLNGAVTLSGHGLALSTNASQSEDNTDDNPVIATVRTRPQGLSASYGPTLPVTVTRWLGTPSLSASWQDARTHTVTLPDGAQATANRMTNSSATLNFVHPKWSWQAGLTSGGFTDLTGLQDNTHNQGPTMGLNFNLGTSLTFGLNAQSLDTHDLKTDSHQRDRNYAMTVSDTSFSGRLTAQLSLSINHNVQQQISSFLPSLVPTTSNTVLKTVAAQLQWIALPATPHRGGLNVGLSLAWNDSRGFNTAALTQSGYGALSGHAYQVFLTVSTSWPLNRGGL